MFRRSRCESAGSTGSPNSLLVSALMPSVWENGDSIVGKGLRSMKIGFVEIKCYRMFFYVDAKGAEEELRRFAGRTHKSLSEDEEFYEHLIAGRFRKTIRMAMMNTRLCHRRIFVQRLRDSLINERLSSTRAKLDAERLVNSVPEFKHNDIVSLIFASDGETVQLWVTEESPAFEVCSTEIWFALQGVFFDARTELTSIRYTAIAGIPELLSRLCGVEILDKDLKQRRNLNVKDFKRADAEQAPHMDDYVMPSVSSRPVATDGNAAAEDSFLEECPQPRSTVALPPCETAELGVGSDISEDSERVDGDGSLLRELADQVAELRREVDVLRRRVDIAESPKTSAAQTASVPLPAVYLVALAAACAAAVLARMLPTAS